MVTAWLGFCVIVSLISGFFAGRGYQIAARAWKDYRATKAQVPILLRMAIAATRGAVGVVVVAVSIAAVALYAASDQ